MSMVEERKLIAYAMERIESVLPGLSSRAVPPLPKGVKVDLSRVIGALIERIEGVLAGSTEPWSADTVWNAGFIASSPSELDSAARRGEERTASDVPSPAEVCYSQKIYICVYIYVCTYIYGLVDRFVT